MLKVTDDDGVRGYSEESVDLTCLGDEENAARDEAGDEAAEQPEDQNSAVFFEVNTNDGSIFELHRNDANIVNCEEEENHDVFSDDEFASICIKVPKRPPTPLVFVNDQNSIIEKSSSPSPSDSVTLYTEQASSEGHSDCDESAEDDNESISCHTLYSLASTASSVTFVNPQRTMANPYTKSTHSLDKSQSSMSIGKLEAVVPRSSDGLRMQGYNFDMTRFAPRAVGGRSLIPGDSADLDVYLSRVCWFFFLIRV